MQLRFVPFAAIAVGGGGVSFPSDPPRSVRGRRRTRRPCHDVVAFSSSEKGSGTGAEPEAEAEAEAEAKREARADEALRRLAELDSQMEGLSEPRKRPPAPPLPPDPYMDRDMITGRGTINDLPELSPTYVAFSTLALFILTIFTNVVFNLYIKPSVDGIDQPVRIQRVPMVNPTDQPSKVASRLDT
ncbi:hypothetical protein GUJ93_ZPchr0013g36911 [Zizania palustris]|uniref:Uncharacterized protein n=1 Tax=Zizania palustris TaxID=103762 RepID=A0A8J6BZ25_ZIZPA|nr:hypothetical protein GUJ93_ZPchr0013g36911 [Zizania palustris]